MNKKNASRTLGSTHFFRGGMNLLLCLFQFLSLEPRTLFAI